MLARLAAGVNTVPAGSMIAPGVREIDRTNGLGSLWGSLRALRA